MKKKSVWLCFVYLCMAVALMGCRTVLPADSTEPSTIETTEPTVETTAPPDPAQIYTSAVEALGTETAAMEISSEQTMTVAGKSFTMNSVQSIGYWNLGTDEFVAQISDTMDFGDYEYTISETFSDGNLYQSLNDCYYTAQMEPDAFMQRYPSLQLLDPALYELSLEEGDTLIRFRNATALEGWLAREDMELNCAEATVKLSADGSVQECTYIVDYDYGSANYTATYTAVYAKSGNAPILPEDPDQYKTVESIDGIWLMDTAYGYLLQAEQYSTQQMSSIQSQAAGMILNTQCSLNTFSNGKSGVDYRMETGMSAMDSTGSYDYDIDEKFIDGKYSAVVDDGDETYDSSVNASLFKSYAQEMLVECIMDTTMLADSSITDLGSLLLIEYTVSEDLALNICENVNYTLFQDPNFLDDYASSYKTNSMEYYLAIDKYTMLPTAVGYYYEGCHTIDGQKYLLVEQMDQSFDLASLTAYEAIHEVPSPDTEPEEKPTPLLYHVTGTDGQEMWLFGTIHVGDDRTGFLPQEIYDALLSSDALAVECDTKGFEEALEDDLELQSEVSDCYYYSDSTVADHLDTEDLYEYAVQVMKATGSYFFNSEYQKAGLWSSSIDNYYLSQGHKLTSEKGIESRLEKFAEDNDIPLREVESSLFQIKMLTGYSDDLQEFQIYCSANGHGKSTWEETEELYELWLSGDEAALIEEMKREPWIMTEEDFPDPEELDEEERARVEAILEDLDNINEEVEVLRQEYVKAMEIDRNAGMLEVVKGYLESGDTVFVAVGLAHLLAEDGLVFTLREAGYTVELVTYN